MSRRNGARHFATTMSHKSNSEGSLRRTRKWKRAYMRVADSQLIDLIHIKIDIASLQLMYLEDLQSLFSTKEKRIYHESCAFFELIQATVKNLKKFERVNHIRAIALRVCVETKIVNNLYSSYSD